MTTDQARYSEPSAFNRHRFDEQLEGIRRALVELGGLVTENVRRVGHAMVHGELSLIAEVKAVDDEVDRLYVEAERSIFSTLALQQPVAGDLRFLIAATRIVYELERSGDLAVNCAKVLERVEGFPESPQLMGRLESIVDAATALYTASIDAIADMTPDAGQTLDAADDEVDELVSRFYTSIGRRSERLGLEASIALTRVGRFLERVADHAVNIGEQVTYAVTAHIAEDETGDPWDTGD